MLGLAGRVVLHLLLAGLLTLALGLAALWFGLLLGFARRIIILRLLLPGLLAGLLGLLVAARLGFRLVLGLARRVVVLRLMLALLLGLVLFGLIRGALTAWLFLARALLVGLFVAVGGLLLLLLLVLAALLFLLFLLLFFLLLQLLLLQDDLFLILRISLSHSKLRQDQRDAGHDGCCCLQYATHFGSFSDGRVKPVAP
ncbi:hypothetical protein [Paracoccus sp. PAR01]|uniref:hypothetical protein n=1 Tax=Paracoccus sp. PAR01 TaxID=2769282 RepID=UPI001CE0EA03|nr:hypothetical protein [Paracoccus sp. PAR01]